MENSEIKIARMEQKIEWIEKNIDSMQRYNEKNFERVINRIDGLDKKFASKTVEKIVYWMVWLILSWVAVAILALVIK